MYHVQALTTGHRRGLTLGLQAKNINNLDPREWVDEREWFASPWQEFVTSFPVTYDDTETRSNLGYFIFTFLEKDDVIWEVKFHHKSVVFHE